ncbi:MAG: phytoene/squalene synthase family protein [Planctomycetota bacterium]
MTTDLDPALNDAYELCRRITAERARSFYLGLRLAPEPERSALYALYAWNRLGDDITDDQSRGSQDRASDLQAFADATREACRGTPVGRDPLWRALADVVASFDIDTASFDAMLAGLARDLDPRQPTTLDDLLSYCDEVAGSVGRCCVAVWGLRGGTSRAEADGLADHLGRAFQLTNVLRDIGEDARLSPQRMYVPADVLDEHGLTPESLIAWSDEAACRSVVLGLAGEARRSFAAGRPLLELVRPRFRPTLWAMRRVYERTLSIVERNPRRSVRTRHVRPSRAVTLTIACRALAMSAIASGRP